MNQKIKLAELETEFVIAQAAFRDSDLNYQEFIRDSSLSDLIEDIEAFLFHPRYPASPNDVPAAAWDVYVKAKVFSIYRDRGRIAAITWKLVEGDAK